jgi:hypothetical protein
MKNITIKYKIPNPKLQVPNKSKSQILHPGNPKNPINPSWYLLTIAAPVGIEINNCDHHHTPFGGGKNNTYLLSVACGAFKRIFGIGTAGGLAFAVIDTAFGQNVLYFSLVNMAAVHSATGMFGINKLAGMAVNNIITGSAAIIRCSLWTMIVNLVIGIGRLVALFMLAFFVAVLLLAFLASGIIHTGG